MSLQTCLRACTLIGLFTYLGCIATAAEPPATKPDSSIDPARSAILKRTEAVAKKLEALRGLKFKADVKKAVLTAEQMRTYVAGALTKHNTPKTFEDEGRVFKALGLIPESMDYQAMMTGQTGSIVSGAYDQWDKTLRLILGRDPGKQTVTIAHELYHGLQHQHWPALLDGKQSIGRDAGNAIRALIEADAMLTEEAFVLGDAGIALDSYKIFLGNKLRRQRTNIIDQMRARGAPAYFVDKNTFEYAEAVNFVHAVYKSGNWKALRGVFDSPPTSTEQILHPERYLTRRDYPTRIESKGLEKHLTDTYGKDHFIVDIAGELLVRSMIRTHLGAGHDVAATGWDGDTYYVWSDPKTQQIRLVWDTLWDSNKDAKEFAQAAKAILEKRRGVALKGGQMKPSVAFYQAAKKGHGEIRVYRADRRVVIYDGLPPKESKAVTKLVSSRGSARHYDAHDTEQGGNDDKPLPALVKPRTLPDAKAPLFTPNTLHYENYRYQWTADLPGKVPWRLTNPTRSQELSPEWIWFINPEQGKLFQISVRSTFVEMDLTLEQRMKRVEQAHIKQSAAYKKLGMKRFKSHGMKGFKYFYVAEHPAGRGQYISRQHAVCVLTDGERLFEIDCMAKPGAFPEKAWIFDAFLKGFKVVHPKKAWPAPALSERPPHNRGIYTNEEFNFRVEAPLRFSLLPGSDIEKSNDDIPGKRASVMVFYRSLDPKIRITAEKVPLEFDLPTLLTATTGNLPKDKTLLQPPVLKNVAGTDFYEWMYQNTDGKNYRKRLDYAANYIHYSVEITASSQGRYKILEPYLNGVLKTLDFIRKPQ